MKKLSNEIFREYDIRGIVGKDIDDDAFYLIARGFAAFLGGSGRVAVGCDIREHSPLMKEAFINGLLESGCDVLDLGYCSSPMAYYAACTQNVAACAVITASHNPKEFNGLKLALKDAKPFYGKQIKELEKIIRAGNFPKGNGEPDFTEIIDEYTEMLAGKTKLKREMEIIVDCGNGIAGLFARNLFEKIGCKAEILFEKPDGTFPNHLPDPTRAEYLSELIKKCKKYRKIGIAFDGDVDRIGLVSEKGELIHGDMLMVLLARAVLERKKGAKIIFDVKCSEILEEDIKKHGGIPIMSKTGHSIIKSLIKEEKAALAGEMSGHIFFADEYYGYDDAAYAACRLLQYLSESGKTVEGHFSGLRKVFSTPELGIECADNLKFRVVENVKEYFLKKYPKSITIDGIRIVQDDGWGLVRASNTQPKIILRFEAKSERALERIQKEVADAVNAEIGDAK